MDVQAVLNAVAKTAARLCDAHDALIFRVDGDQLRLVAKHGAPRTTWAVGKAFPLNRNKRSTSVTSRKNTKPSSPLQKHLRT